MWWLEVAVAGGVAALPTLLRLHSPSSLVPLSSIPSRCGSSVGVWFSAACDVLLCLLLCLVLCCGASRHLLPVVLRRCQRERASTPSGAIRVSMTVAIEPAVDDRWQPSRDNGQDSVFDQRATSTDVSVLITSCFVCGIFGHTTVVTDY